jgi:hypothetical protein
MAEETDDDVSLLNNNNDDDDDEQLITPEDRQPNVEAVFVVTFDVKTGKIKRKKNIFFSVYLMNFQGNKIEFQMPESEQMSLMGVENKAIPSGSHHINQDFV